MNVNQSVGHLWDGIILISACFYNKSLNSQAANTSPAHMQTINNYSSPTPRNKKSPSAVLYLPSGLSWRLLPTRTWAVLQVQVCWSEPSSNTSSKILQQQPGYYGDTIPVRVRLLLLHPLRAADLFLRFRQLGGGAARRAERSCASLWPLPPPVRASGTSRLTGADAAGGEKINK